jgi:hypothetical protein
VLSVLTILTACSSRPKDDDKPKTFPVALFNAQIRIVDKASNKSHTVQAQIRHFQQRLRADFTGGGVGVYLGALVAKPDSLQLLLARERKLYESPNPNASLKGLFGVDVRPKWLSAFVLDQNPGPEFFCTFTFEQKPVRCVSERDSLVMEWVQREGSMRQVLVKSPQFEMEVSLAEKPPKVQDPEQVFILAIPKGYRTLNL